MWPPFQLTGHGRTSISLPTAPPSQIRKESEPELAAQKFGNCKFRFALLAAQRLKTRDFWHILASHTLVHLSDPSICTLKDLTQCSRVDNPSARSLVHLQNAA